MATTSKQQPAKPRAPRLSFSDKLGKAVKELVKIASNAISADEAWAKWAAQTYPLVQRDAREYLRVYNKARKGNGSKPLSYADAERRVWRKVVADVRKTISGEGNERTFKTRMSHLYRILSARKAAVQKAVSVWRRGKYGQPHTFNSVRKLMRSKSGRGNGRKKVLTYQMSTQKVKALLARASNGKVTFTFRLVAGRLVK